MRRLLALFLLCSSAAFCQQTGAMLGLPQVFTNTNQFTLGITVGPITFSQLAGISTSTTFIYVSDATLGSSPCTGSGSGALAVRINGAWNCSVAGSGGSGITGSGTTGTIPVFTSSTAVGNSVIRAGTSSVDIGALSPIAPSANGSAIFFSVRPSGTCTGSPGSIPTVGCFGFDMQMVPSNVSSTGVTVGARIENFNSFSPVTLQIGTYSQVGGGFNVTEERAIDAEAYDNANQTTTTRRAIFAIAQNNSGNTTAANEAIVAQTGETSSTNTRDITIHVLPPALVGGAMTFHAGIGIDAQGIGVPLQQSPENFSTLPTCSSTFEGSTASVNDSTTNTWGATVSGSGSDHVLAYCDGTNWTVAGK